MHLLQGVLGIPSLVGWMFVVIFAGHIFLSKTRFGNAYATGGIPKQVEAAE